MKKIRTRRVAVQGLILGLVLVVSFLLLPDFIAQMRAGKYQGVGSDAVASPTAAMPVAEQQTEPHTCGLHAMRSLYVAYGLDPDDFRLRFRLGTDEPAMRADDESTGTLHPDLYRVLAQDGFHATPIDLSEGGAAEQIAQHLEAGQLALAVVYRSTYHWVVLAGGAENGELAMVDSLAEEPTTMPVSVFLDEALSITLVSPGGAEQPVDVTDAHARGLSEMARLVGRR